ncbi:MAG: hypothetical protein JRG86_20635, partial [Deltaproteobacteria bacterium]|nr:hypothetical protein [Deltaproteobacteria bacterium]
MSPEGVPGERLLDFHRRIAEGGVDWDEGLRVARTLDRAGIDAIIIS